MFEDTLAEDFTHQLTSRKMVIQMAEGAAFIFSRALRMAIGKWNEKNKWFDGKVTPKRVGVFCTENN